MPLVIFDRELSGSPGGEILLIDELQVEDMMARSNPRVEVLVLELEREPEFRGVEADRFSQVRRAQLWNDVRYHHDGKSSSRTPRPSRRAPRACATRRRNSGWCSRR